MTAFTIVAATAPDPVIPDFGQASDCVSDNGFFCVDWFTANWSSVFWPALLEHVRLTVIAVGIGFVLAFAAALLAHFKGRLEAPFGGLAAFLYTIPPLALFELLVPGTGVSILTVEIALVAYTLMVLFKSTLAGLREVPADVRRVGEGMGLTRMQILLRIELPLAVPSILAGLRVTTVTTISTVEIAAFIIDQGLGSPILQGLQSPFTTQFVAAGALAVALALAADGLIVAVGRLLSPWAAIPREN
ncbi:glycine/betaine ABC transporter permease [Actinomadura sp. NBRC 104412]|uniref:ABC transporter permease n=1 Tax=Actinomadura sp. NBRC 104412 TaxID=3032203 RepID=UPI0024A08441|nr:ABC transporter permease subunit [Actinomadura sp. NBRC 104412]GLZ09571.1 glycine/betaine ABC transporter permease [Actinomadura sp. NBRC 104412]